MHVIPDYTPTAGVQGSKSYAPTNFPVSIFPPPGPDLGALITGPLTGESLKDWQPKGILVAHLHEHKGPVNQLQVTQDNMFFASASDDGTVKIWDCQRLEKNVTNRSRLTYSLQRGKIKCISICENSHSVAAGSDDGSIHIFKIEYATKKDSTLNRYTGAVTIKNIDTNEGCIVGLEHYNLDPVSLLVYGTTKGCIHGWDLRTRQQAWMLNNPISNGLLSTFVVEPGRNWLVTGTNSGFFTCWDLRFNIPVKTWRHPSKSRINKLVHCNSIKYSSWIFSTCAGNPNEISVWDVESGSCKQLFRILSREEAAPPTNMRGAADTQVIDYGVEELQRPTVVNVNQNDAGIKCMLNPVVDCSFLVTAGDDKRIRYWNLQNAINSYTICGLGKDQPKPRYSSHIYDNLTVYQEHPNSEDSPDSPANASKLRGPASPSVHHHESILDVKMMELPHRMLISGSRDGVIKVWK